MKSEGIWQDHSKQWKLIGPPLRPSGQDIEFLQRIVAEICIGRDSPQALLLGVTEEIATMRWPRNTHLLAVDHSAAMIQNVWPGNPLVHASALCSEWTRLPVEDQGRDVVVGDGCFTALAFPEELEGVMREIRRVLKPDGVFAMRVFVRPDEPEPVGAVIDDLLAGRIANFHLFKWRLAMALHGDLASGVRIGDVWSAWNDAVPEPAVLAAKLNWPPETIRTIDAYRGRDTRYLFPRMGELRRLLEGRFSEMACLYPDYPLGERCPTMGLRPLSGTIG